MQITIRPVKESDYSQLIDLFKEFALFEKLPEKMINTVEKIKSEKEYFHCFVAETEEGHIAGYASYFIAYYTWTGKSLYMDDLYVQPDFRGTGIGTKLISKIIDFAKSSHCHQLRWQVSEWNDRAIGFYKNLGAEINEVERNCDLFL